MYYLLVAVLALAVGAVAGRRWPSPGVIRRSTEPPADGDRDAVLQAGAGLQTDADPDATVDQDFAAGPDRRIDPDHPSDGDDRPVSRATIGVVPVSDEVMVAESPGERDARVDASVAGAIIAVTERLTSLELRRRLFGAIRLLPDMAFVDPLPGEPFDRLRHEWIETRPAGSGERPETVAEVLLPGVVDPAGRLMCAAKVAVFDTDEE